MDDLKCQNDSQLNDSEILNNKDNEISNSQVLTQSQAINEKINENVIITKSNDIDEKNEIVNYILKSLPSGNTSSHLSILPAATTNNNRLIDSVRNLLNPIGIVNNITSSISSTSATNDRINALLKPIQFNYAPNSLPKKSAPILIDLIKSSNMEIEKTINANMDIVYEQMRSSSKLSADDNSNNVLKLLYTIPPANKKGLRKNSSDYPNLLNNIRSMVMQLNESSRLEYQLSLLQFATTAPRNHNSSLFMSNTLNMANLPFKNENEYPFFADINFLNSSPTLPLFDLNSITSSGSTPTLLIERENIGRDNNRN